MSLLAGFIIFIFREFVEISFCKSVHMGNTIVV